MRGLLLIPPLKSVGAGIAGAVVSRMIPGLVSKVGLSVPTAGATGLAVRAAGGVLGGALVAKFMGREAGENFALGALISVGDDAFHTYVAPSVGLGSYLSPSMRSYLAPGANLAPRRSSAMAGVPSPSRFSSAARF
jgi:hypothetical protein